MEEKDELFRRKSIIELATAFSHYPDKKVDTFERSELNMCL